MIYIRGFFDFPSFSSTFLANKGILKPDIMTPGTKIVSANSERSSNKKRECSPSQDNIHTCIYVLLNIGTFFVNDSKSRFYLRISFLLVDLINDACIYVLLNIGAFFVIKNKFSAGELFISKFKSCSLDIMIKVISSEQLDITLILVFLYMNFSIIMQKFI